MQMLNCKETIVERNLPKIVPAEKKFKSIGFESIRRKSSIAKESSIDLRRQS